MQSDKSLLSRSRELTSGKCAPHHALVTSRRQRIAQQLLSNSVAMTGVVAYRSRIICAYQHPREICSSGSFALRLSAALSYLRSHFLRSYLRTLLWPQFTTVFGRSLSASAAAGIC